MSCVLKSVSLLFQGRELFIVPKIEYIFMVPYLSNKSIKRNYYWMNKYVVLTDNQNIMFDA